MASLATVVKLDAADAEKVRRDAFKAKLRKAIEDATPQPKTEGEADRVVKQGAKEASGALHGEVAAQSDVAAGPLKTAAASEVPASSQEAPPATALKPEPVGPAPAPVSAAPVVPAPLPAERLDYS